MTEPMYVITWTATFTGATGRDYTRLYTAADVAQVVEWLNKLMAGEAVYKAEPAEEGGE